MQNAGAAAASWAAEVPTLVWTLAVLSVTWWYLGLQSRRKAAARNAADARGAPPPQGIGSVEKGGVGATAAGATRLDATGGRAVVAGAATAAAAAAVAAAVAAAEPYEPEPPSDPVAKARMKRLVAGLDAEWAASGPPLLDTGGAMRVWHRPEGGSVHSFKYEVVMPLGPEPCVALAKELDLMPTWHKFVPTGAVLAQRPGIFGGIYAYATMWMPWPLKHRGILCQSAFFDCLDDPSLGGYIVYVSSLERAPPPSAAPHNDGNEDGASGEETKAGSGSSQEGADASASQQQQQQQLAAEVDDVLARVPTSDEQCPRMRFESYTTFQPLANDPATGHPRTVWCFYFDRTDYQVELPAFVLGFLMKICAPFVLATAVGLARAVPPSYVDRIARDANFYGPLGRRCRQQARKLAAWAAAAAPAAPRARRAAVLKRASLVKPPPKVAGARLGAARKAHSLLDLRQAARAQEALGHPAPPPTPPPRGAPRDAAATAGPSPSSSSSSSSSSGSPSGGGGEGQGIRGGAEDPALKPPAPLSRRQMSSHESCLF